MKGTKWIVATLLLAFGLSAGAFAEDRRDGDRDRDHNIYAQQVWRNHDRDWRNNYRDRDDRGRQWTHRDRDHDRGRHDRDDRGPDRR